MCEIIVNKNPAVCGIFVLGRWVINDLTLGACVCKIFVMKKLFLFGLILAVFGAARPADAYVDRQTAVVRIMNKAAGKVQTVALPVGVPTQFEKLDMVVRSCKQTDPFDAQDFYMFIEINKSDEGKIYSGWTSANEPGDNPVQNADYDLWLVRCE